MNFFHTTSTLALCRIHQHDGLDNDFETATHTNGLLQRSRMDSLPATFICDMSEIWTCSNLDLPETCASCLAMMTMGVLEFEHFGGCLFFHILRFAQVIHEHQLFDVPKIIDVCVIYGDANRHAMVMFCRQKDGEIACGIPAPWLGSTWTLLGILIVILSVFCRHLDFLPKTC